jgi:hypothetical protein
MRRRRLEFLNLQMALMGIGVAAFVLWWKLLPPQFEDAAKFLAGAVFGILGCYVLVLRP